VKDLAAKAVGDAKTPREKVERLVPFVKEYVKDELRPEAVSVLEIISSKRGDCSEHTMLFVTLARAAGVPARGVSGLMYMGDDALAFATHAWAEVVLDGKWVPVDPTWGQTEVDATQVTLEREGKGKKDMISSLGRLNFRVKELESKP
jgi:transglutaminase-like putative cysteine protease